MSYELCWETPEDRDNVLELLGAAFPEPPEFFAGIISKDPWYHYCQRRLLKIEGQIVSSVDLFTRKIWIGESPVLVGDLGNVSTHPDQRRKGYCSAVVKDLISYMNSQGYGSSTLYGGAPEFYESLGWRLFPDKKASIILDGKIKAPNGFRTKKNASLEDLPNIAALYNKYSNQETGITIRSIDYWKKHFHWLTDLPNHLVVVYKDLEMIGFGRYSLLKDAATIREIGYVAEVTDFIDVLMSLVAHICSNEIKSINISYFAADHPIAHLGNRGIKLNISDNSVLRMRLVNMESLFSNMLPKLRMRLEAASNMNYENRIILRCEIGNVTFQICKNSLNVLDSGSGGHEIFFQQRDLIRLILGDVSIRDIEFGGKEELAVEDIEILNALFPKNKPIYWQNDHF